MVILIMPHLLTPQFVIPQLFKLVVTGELN